MTNTAIKFFWNGLKDAGEPRAPGKRPSLVGGHWSYQAANETIGLAEGISFYFSGYSDRSGEIATAMGGTPSRSTLDDCFYVAKFNLTPDHPRWSEAVAMYVKQERRAHVRMERRLAKTPADTFLANELAHARRQTNAAEARA